MTGSRGLMPAMDTMEQGVQRWIRGEIRALSAYHVPPAQGFVKLDAMENPYRWPEPLLDAWLQRLRNVALNRYPDPAATELKSRLRTAFEIPAGQDLLLGNGSDELIQLLALAVAEPGRTILAPEPSFVMYRMIATFAGMEYVGVPLRTDDFALDRDAMLEAIETHQPALVFIAHPNNPTGNLFDPDIIQSIIEAAPGLVVIDEAYSAFADHSFMDALGRYPNLLVMRTVSKMGLAGLRLGLLAGPQVWLQELDKVRLPYNINVLTQASAEFALQHKDVLDAQTAAIRADRASLAEQLSLLPELQVYPSQANFLLLRVPAGRAEPIFAYLREHGVLIKNLHRAGPLLRDCVRVTVGTQEENQRFLEVFREALQQHAVG